jgi:GH24 family phage-related lysozyme (muramidase)
MRRLTIAFLVALGMLIPASPAGAVSKSTAEFIAGFEGYYGKPYNDPAGFATVGYGHLLGYRPVSASDRKDIWVRGQKKPGYLSQVEAMRLLRTDLAKYEAQVFQRIGKARVTGPMVTALTSFTFNLGAGYLDFRKSNGFTRQTNIAWHVRKGNYLTAARQMRIFDGVISGGKRYVLAGLTRRRNDEFQLMIKGIRQLGKCGLGCISEDNSGGMTLSARR